MNRLSEPIRVTPPPPAVPRWTVVPSRNTLRSPISTRVSSPRYLRSCGTRPIELNGKKRLRSPIAGVAVDHDVRLEHACRARAAPRARRRRRAPPARPARARAPGATRASGSTSGARQRRHLQQQARLRRARVAHAHVAAEARELAAAVLELHLEPQLVAGHHRPPELRVVEADDADLERARVGRRLQQPDARGLRQRLEDQHPGHHRLPGEVPGEEVLAAGDVLRGDQPPARVVLEDAVHEHERVLGRDLADEPSDLA